jgi:hypothetical protein
MGETRSDVEHKAAQRLHTFFWLHEATFTNAPRRSLSDMVRELGAEYPADLHEKFRMFGRDAGFTNSLYERYFFVPPGISNEVIKGELVLLNASPYLNERSELVRMAIIRRVPGYEGWSYGEFPEALLQRLFHEAGVALPKARQANAAPTAINKTNGQQSISRAIQIHFRNMARYLGMGTGSWWLLLLAGTAILVSLVATAFFFVFVRQSDRNRQSR